MKKYNDISQKRAEEITGLKLPRSVSERKKVLRGKLPYGVYVLSDGSEVLYNRDYVPIYPFGDTILDGDGKPLSVDYDFQYYFYDDGSVPSEPDNLIQRKLKIFGLHQPFPEILKTTIPPGDSFGCFGGEDQFIFFITDCN